METLANGIALSSLSYETLRITDALGLVIDRDVTRYTRFEIYLLATLLSDKK